jgi:hypothetical protein
MHLHNTIAGPIKNRPFEAIANRCWVFEYALDEAGISLGYYRNQKSAGNKRLEFCQHPRDNRISLVAYDTISEKHQEQLKVRWGCPYEYVAKQPIRSLLTLDAKAEQYYRDYRYGGGKQLPPEHITKYTIAASWLNVLLKLKDDKAFIKKQLKISLETFWKLVMEVIVADSIDLPASYRNLTEQVRNWKAAAGNDRYDSLIDWRFGNKLSAKIGKTEAGFDADLELKQMAVINKLSRLHMNLDAVQIADMAKKIFEKNGWATISASLVKLRLNENMTTLMPGRQGARAYNNKVAMQVQRERPQYPLHYLTMDGWTVELLYQDGSTYNNRLVMVVVLDVMNNYPVGYAIGERENTDLIRMALRNTLLHIQELTGAMHRPWQLQSDRYGLKSLTPFYNAISHLYTPAAVGNAKSKVVEPYFKYLNKKYCQLQFNWSGFNITAKKGNQPNTEFLDKIKTNFPTKEGVVAQIEAFMQKERAAKVPTYMAQWQLMPADDKVAIPDADALMIHGQLHKELNSITGPGLIATLDGQKMTFDSFEPEFRALQFSTKFKLVYDANDFSQVVAITEDGKQKFLLHNKLKVGMGYKNTTPEQLAYRAQIDAYNKDRKEEILQKYIDEDAIVQQVIANTPLNLDDQDEAALKLMFTYKGQQKEKLQDAKGLKNVQKSIEKTKAKEAKKAGDNWQQMQALYLQEQTNINEYLD